MITACLGRITVGTSKCRGLGCRLKCCYFDSIPSSRFFFWGGGGGEGGCLFVHDYSDSQLLCIYVFIVWFLDISGTGC